MIRPGDIALAVAGLVVLSPVLLIVSLLVRSNIGSPVLFVQRRVGKHGNPFDMYKFRTIEKTASPLNLG